MPILPTLLLLALLAIVVHGFFAARSFPARVAALAGRVSRRRMVAAWAAGLWVTYGMSALIALLLTGRAGAIVDMPVELTLAAWTLGLPGWADDTALPWLGGELALGAVLGLAILRWRRWRGRAPIGLRYRSPAAVAGPGEWPAATALALAAGVGEELLFRLTLPLLVAIVTGSGVAGVAVGLAAFVALHRHQGLGGMLAVALVGAVLTMLYLATGRLWLVVLLHVAIDLNALVLRPMIGPRVSS